MKKLIVTGDDFGLAVPVNEAIEEAHERGILTAASLMVGADAAADAVNRARRRPSLRVGLHLVLVEGRPVLPPAEIPALVEGGAFSRNLVRAGFRFFFRPGARQQMEKEIRAQFQAFKGTGLLLDHVNAHNHMHLHPTVLSLILKVGSEFGLRAVRFPYEPPIRSWRASGKALFGKIGASTLLSPWMRLMKSRLQHSHIHSNDFVFGLHDSGAMNRDLVLRFLDHLPEGTTEMYFHPATRRCPEIDRSMPRYQHREEFEALVSPIVRDALAVRGVQTIAFNDL